MSKFLFKIDPEYKWSGTPNNDEDRTATWDPSTHIITKKDMDRIIGNCDKWGCKIAPSTTTDITIEVPGLYASWKRDRFPVDKMFIPDINKLEVTLHWPPSGHNDDDETENEPEEDKDHKVVPKKVVKKEVLDSDDDSDVVSTREKSENRKSLNRKNPTPDNDDHDVASTAPASKRAPKRKSQLRKVVKNEVESDVDFDDDSDVVSTRKKFVNRKNLNRKNPTPDNDDHDVASTAPPPKSASNQKSQLPKVVKKEVKTEIKVEVDNRTPEQKEIEELEEMLAYKNRELESLPDMRVHWQNMNEKDGKKRISEVKESYKENVRQSIRYWIEKSQQSSKEAPSSNQINSS